MEYCYGHEREIRTKDLLIYILYKWRSILLTAMAGCVLAGIYTVWNISATASNDTENLWQKLWNGQNAVLKKWVFIGFAAGILVSMFYHAMGYTSSDKIRGERELKERYGYHLLGVFHHRKKRCFLSCIDRQLEKWEGYSKDISEEETYRIIAANITNLAGDGGLLLVTGTVDIERLQEFSSIILTQLNENILLVTGSDMSENADTLEALAECDAVILVEERNKSSRVKIQREQDSIEAFGKNVMGYVLL
ncbi:hypothetical protein NSB25_04605 [Acetatifactor muris]|uniref:Uncharacterized protein n=1 Tax=Acetatifactor muris TaxID=879566 RepID=A0A2K4ZCG9_9FIRM|nr:hypothetical protein [Acetatifactor muris]MCR2046558.1 hypothetical protein [Acetatifactor muris]SOY28148.1 hypothetical protein AMURIS_00855 [Acetatifactor muris]